MRIKNIMSGKVIFRGKHETMKEAVISAIFSGVDLSRANLSGADLSRADLSGVYLSGVDLSGANMSRANLSGADFSLAYIYKTEFFRNKVTKKTKEQIISLFKFDEVKK